MGNWLPSHYFVEMGIGAVLIAVHAYGRYNTPESNRSSTTRSQFIACWLAYALALNIVYWLVTVTAWLSPEVAALVLQISWEPADDAELARMLQSPITTALLFTSLLPNVPLLRRLDRKLLQFFWDLGEIPGHAIKLAHRMYRSRFNIPPPRLAEIERDARKYDIDIGQLDFNDRSSPIYVWAVNCTLLLQIERWNQGWDPHYKRFIARRQQELEEIKAEYATFSSRVAAYHRRLAEMQQGPQAFLEELREDLLDDGRQRFMRLCKFLAHAVLSVEIGVTARGRRLEALGFDLSLNSQENLSAVQLIKLTGIILGTFLGIALLRYLFEGPSTLAVAGNIVFFALLMSINYGISAFLGIYPKTRWRFADIEVTGRRPWAGYLFSGAMAVMVSLAMIAALRYTRYVFEIGNLGESFERLLENLGWSYPYLFLSFVIAFCVAWITDSGNGRSSVMGNRRANTLVMGVAVTVTYLIVYAAMHGLGPFEGTKLPRFRNTEHLELLYFAAAHLLIGAVIGRLVPHWYRSNRYRTPVQRVIRFIDRNSRALWVEAGRLRPGELREAIVVGTAAMTAANGTVDEMEKETIRRSLGELADHEILDFHVDTAMQDVMEKIRRWQKTNRDMQHPSLDAVEALRGRQTLSELLVQIGAAVGLADDTFDQFEQTVLGELIRALGLEPKQCLASCGLSHLAGAKLPTTSPTP